MNAERSAALVRRWVAFYTLGLPPETKLGRRDEIADDLWCQAQEAAEAGRADRSLAGEILARLLFGVPADVSWRVEQRLGRTRTRPEGSPTMYARLPAVLALVGGAAWTIWPIGEALTHALTGPWDGGVGQTLTLVSAVAGTVVLALATLSLVAAAHDAMSGVTATLAVMGALISTLVVVDVGPAIVALPVGSIVVVWQLSRVGAVPGWLFLTHAAGPVVALTFFLIGLSGFGDELGQTPLVWLVLVTFLYPLSWLVLGWSLLRGRSAAIDLSGASAA